MLTTTLLTLKAEKDVLVQINAVLELENRRLARENERLRAESRRRREYTGPLRVAHAPN